MAPGDGSRRDRDRERAAEALNRYWDDLVRGRGATRVDRPPPDDVDPTLATAIHRLHGLDETPAPDAAFGARLWQGLVSPVLAGRGAGQPPAEVPAPGGSQPLRLVRPTGGWSFGRLATAAALVLAVLGGTGGGRGLIPALPGGSPTVSAGEPAPTTVVPDHPWPVATPTPGTSGSTSLNSTRAGDVMSNKRDATRSCAARRSCLRQVELCVFARVGRAAGDDPRRASCPGGVPLGVVVRLERPLAVGARHGDALRAAAAVAAPASCIW